VKERGNNTEDVEETPLDGDSAVAEDPQLIPVAELQKSVHGRSIYF
jgi:hypothetical protein